jgi:cytochrome b561
MPVNKKRYDAMAIILHWVMAISFLLMLGSGFALAFLESIPRSLAFSMIQWHKSLGLLLLVAFFLRIAWRLFHKPPPLPSSIKKLDKKAAIVGHWALYIFMLAMPISGWIMVSSSVYGLPTFIFGWFEWPHIPGIAGDETVNAISYEAHEIMAWIFLSFIVIHVAAVIKHYLIDGENLLRRMFFLKDQS